MRKTIKKVFPHIVDMKGNIVIRKWGMDLYRQHRRYNLSAPFKARQSKSGYIILLNGHALEKGMTSKNPRRFGVNKVGEITEQFKLYEKNGWDKDFAYDFGISILSRYCSFYEKYGWTDAKEYQSVKELIAGKKSKLETGTISIRRDSYIKDAEIDYDKFLSSRHSIRSFQSKKISAEDMKKAVKMAIKTPTACNRQMLKVYFVRDDKVKNKIIKYSKGMTGFDNDTANMIVVTYDVSSFRRHELNQGLFNAGLFATNLVNALHSLGIGSCMLEYWVKTKEENEEKKILNIPDNEKIAIVIAAGYYPEETVVPRSVRKPLEEVYRER